MTVANPSFILALDVGSKRVGVAIASTIARLPRPLTTLERGDSFFKELQELITSEDVGALVVGWPRGLSGQHTQQTESTSDFIEQLRSRVSLPVHMQDEALTSQKAEDELSARGTSYAKGDIDALAATYILEDFLHEHPSLEGVTA